ncbi:hypothetical protein SH668x_001776 [Planctomicrobium sp. SH668]|uniref:hypothetical protein n=1 Tax=Planctomicrobium sp. SH668 TaxID=3448126 RepID=UPI003F5BA3DA
MPIRVTAIKRSGRKCFEARWIDPVTGKKKTLSTAEVRRREAERFASDLEMDLNSEDTEENAKEAKPTIPKASQVNWAKFRLDYEEIVYPSQKPKTRSTTTSTFNAIEKLINPKTPRDLHVDAIREFTKEVRKLPARKKVTRVKML